MDGLESHYRFSLPAATYLGVLRRDLGDLRVLNATGDPVPYAFVPARTEAQTPAERRDARLFPLYGEQGKSLDAVNIRIQQTVAGTVIDVPGTAAAPSAERKLLGYVVDTGEEKEPIEALLLEWGTPGNFTASLRVEASGDLKRWSTLVAAAPVLLLEHAGERLERKRVELAGAQSRYLRLSFTGVPRDFALEKLRLELRPRIEELHREWRSMTAAESRSRRGEYEFDIGGPFPVDRLRLALPEPNTVAQAQLFARERIDDPWRPVAAATVYRLRRDSGEVVNPDIAIARTPSRYWLVRVDQRGGGLGAGDVGLEIGWIPHEVVFAARGSGPFTLAYGMKFAKPAAMPIATVLPDYRSGEPVTAKVATVADFTAVAREPVSLFREPLTYLRAAAESGEAKKWILWSSLILGVVLLLWMAFSLLKQVGRR